MNIPSYSPTINEKIYDNIFSISDTDTISNKYDKNLLLNLLKIKKINNPKKLLVPRQILSNCWFNTMFINFFFSDKGRKFFKYFRYLMITGEKIDLNKKIIISNKLKNILFILNLYIEKNLNQKNSVKTRKFNIKQKKTYKTKNIDKYLKKLYYQYNIHEKDTNYFIKNIYLLLKKYDKSLPNINQGGNPIVYYKSLINFLDNSKIHLLEYNITQNININININNLLINQKNLPHLILFNDFQSKTHYDTTYTFNNITYKLDSIILTNKDYFEKNKNRHFVSVITINNIEYKFDGSSIKKLSKFKWKNKINKNIDWTFIEDPKYYSDLYNFTYGYKILFYYRIN